MLWDFFKNKNYILLLLNSPEAPLTFSPTYLTGYKPYYRQPDTRSVKSNQRFFFTLVSFKAVI